MTFVVGLAGLLTAMLICAAQKECFARDARSCVRTLKMLREVLIPLAR